MTAILQFDRIIKRFPGVLALDEVSFEVGAGTVHALVGENGAGKSTLGKIVAGILRPDGGRMLLEGRKLVLRDPRHALWRGIGMVHQELSFCENLSVAENLCLANLPRRWGFLSTPLMRRRAREMLEGIGVNLDVDRRIGELSVAQQQMVQIAQAVAVAARIIVFDEPTSSLTIGEAQRLFQLIHHLKGRGVTMIYVTHRLAEVFQICDAVTVLRDGRHVATQPAAGVDETALVRQMIGRPLEEYFPRHLSAEPGEELLRVSGLSSPGKFTGVSFSVRAGEIVGLAGLVGSGRSEVAQAIFGLDKHARGRIEIAEDAPRSAAGLPLGNAPGRPLESEAGLPSRRVQELRRIKLGSVPQSMRRGIGLTPEDRKRQGLVLMLSAKANFSLAVLDRWSRFGLIDGGRERREAEEYFSRLDVRAPSIDTVAAALSGGNQQKIVLARWLACRSKVFIVDEPTRGVDVGAKAAIHALIDDLARSGVGILLISSELPEVVNLSTRILVMREGRLVGQLPRQDATQERLMRLMAGVEAVDPRPLTRDR